MKKLDTIQERKQGIRLRRLRLGVVAWSVAFVLVLYGWSLGLIDMALHTYLTGSAVVLLMQLGFLVTIRRGWNLNLRDPSLTLVHVLFATVVALWVVSHADEARSILLMLYIIAMFFGIFHLRKSQSILITTFAVGGYATIVAIEFLMGTASRSHQLIWLELGVFAVVMFWLALAGAYVADLRLSLSRRNRELQKTSRHLEFLAAHDELTGLRNRRKIFEQLEQARRQYVSDGTPFCIAMLDLDHFKKVNDLHGHMAGDRVLEQFATRVQATMRGEDQFSRVDRSVADMGRFGGEEFLAILPDTDVEQAQRAAERLRLVVADAPFTIDSDGESVDCTVSIGVAEYRPGEEIRHTLTRADQALYEAKRGGRNQVSTGAEPGSGDQD